MHKTHVREIRGETIAEPFQTFRGVAEDIVIWSVGQTCGVKTVTPPLTAL